MDHTLFSLSYTRTEQFSDTAWSWSSYCSLQTQNVHLLIFFLLYKAYYDSKSKVFQKKKSWTINYSYCIDVLRDTSLHIRLMKWHHKLANVCVCCEEQSIQTKENVTKWNIGNMKCHVTSCRLNQVQGKWIVLLLLGSTPVVFTVDTNICHTHM